MKCLIFDCDKTVRIKKSSLCARHYRLDYLSKRPICSVQNCNAPQEYLSAGLCANHYNLTDDGLRVTLRAKYGITLEAYKQMIVDQNNKCAICFSSTSINRNGESNRLCVDHNHETRTVRGLLCHACNRGLGAFKDNLDNLKAAIAYLEQYK